MLAVILNNFVHKNIVRFNRKHWMTCTNIRLRFLSVFIKIHAIFHKNLKILNQIKQIFFQNFEYFDRKLDLFGKDLVF